MPGFPALDVLALAAHPDDVELRAGGTMCVLARDGYRSRVSDLLNAPERDFISLTIQRSF